MAAVTSTSMLVDQQLETVSSTATDLSTFITSYVGNNTTNSTTTPAASSTSYSATESPPVFTTDSPPVIQPSTQPTIATSSPSSSPGAPSDGNSGNEISTGMTVSAGVGCAAGGALLLGLVVWWCRPKKRKSKPGMQQMSERMVPGSSYRDQNPESEDSDPTTAFLQNRRTWS